jgi:ectoine hydroxylase-related dioxygenase (phytanoyl-CoA dioxygenase family)
MTNKEFWDKNGYIQIDNMLSHSELAVVSQICDSLLSGTYDTEGLRSDLSGKSDSPNQELITQIMCPSSLNSDFSKLPHFKKTRRIAIEILGDDIDVDFDMIINKRPNTLTETPWHQDAAYWPSLEDKRACSFWIALDDVNQVNGCMMYIPSSHQSEILRKHEFAHEGGALKTIISKDEDIYIGELSKGSTIGHHGHTIHGALGNRSINNQRRAWIINYRPNSMIRMMRDNGYNHTGQRKNAG